MSATVLKIDAMRPRRGVQVPAWVKRIQNALGLPLPGPPTHFEIWGRGAKSYVMVCCAPMYLNVSLDLAFAGRAEARKWAASYLARTRLDIPEKPKAKRRRRAA